MNAWVREEFLRRHGTLNSTHKPYGQFRYKAFSVVQSARASGPTWVASPNVVLYVFMDSYDSDLRAQYLHIDEDGVEPARDMLGGR